MMPTLVWTGVLTGVAWADWRTRSVAWSTLLGATLLTLVWYPPWIEPSGWLAACLTVSFMAVYVWSRTRRHPHTVVWGLADYWIASLTILWVHGSWLTEAWLIVATFGLQLLWSGWTWWRHHRLSTTWPWLVGYWFVWGGYTFLHIISR
ncbi:hypothetical protein [Sulfobacillus thermosulfidooxidans]|uniref:hypothetical protein n=1 Tax=Sulfobacillus thermosulfidooxidans TaxID=28034 RepID=UPI0006B43772|nr:hypothetical protein [Sulfobacillus thermosulfidooxidans]